MFVSYVRENLSIVDRLVGELRNRGADVWFDQDALPPGVVWREEIRRAVTRHEYFLACFSHEQNMRARAYMNEELELAIEEIRLRGNAPWFIPVRLSGEIPDIRIGPTRTLRDLQYVDLQEDRWTTGIDAIARAIGLHGPQSGSAQSLGDPLAALTFTPPDTVALHVPRPEHPLRIERSSVALFAAALAIATALSIAMFQMRRPSRGLEPRVNVENALLQPDGMRGPGNEPLLVTPRPDERDFLLIPALPPSASQGGTSTQVRLELIDLNAGQRRRIWSQSGVHARRDGTLPVLVPGPYLKIGTYQLVVSQDRDGGNELATYTIRVARETSK